MHRRKIDDQTLLQMTEEGKSGKECAMYFNCSDAAISKRLRRLQAAVPPESLTRLPPKEQKFCLAVAGGSTYTEAALQSYECSSRGSAKSIGSELAGRPEIDCCIRELMVEQGLTKRYRLAKLKQHIDARSPEVSLKALDQSWRLDGSYAPEKHVSLTVDFDSMNAKLKELELEEARLLQELGMIDEN